VDAGRIAGGGVDAMPHGYHHRRNGGRRYTPPVPAVDPFIAQFSGWLSSLRTYLQSPLEVANCQTSSGAPLHSPLAPDSPVEVPPPPHTPTSEYGGHTNS
jgi:hypothetical protein